MYDLLSKRVIYFVSNLSDSILEFSNFVYIKNSLFLLVLKINDSIRYGSSLLQINPY